MLILLPYQYPCFKKLPCCWCWHIRILLADAEKAVCSTEAARKESPEDSSSKEEKKELKEGLVEKFTSCRWVVGYLCCTARFCQSAIRQLMGMAVVCMTLRSTSPTLTQTTSDNNTIDTNDDSTAPPNVVRIRHFEIKPKFVCLSVYLTCLF